MNKLYKILIWLTFTLFIYFFVLNLIIYFDPNNTNDKGLKSLSSFVAILSSYFLGSFLARK